MRKLLTTALALFSVITSAFATPVNFNVAERLPINDGKTAIVMSDSLSLSELGQQLNQTSNGEFLRQLKAALSDDEHAMHLTFHGVGNFNTVYVKLLAETPVRENVAWQNLGGEITAWLQDKAAKPLPVLFDIPGITAEQQANAMLGMTLRGYHFSRYQQDKPLDQHFILVSSVASEAQQIFNQDLVHIADGIYLARDMANEPGNAVYPIEFVDRIKAQFKGVDNVDIKVLNVRQMRKLNMGALLGVGRGSIHEPRLLVIEYNGVNDGHAPIALVGKGVTFDTGGISLKPNNNMWTMKSDLSGAAAVAGTMLAIAKREAPVNVVGLMPLAENMPAEDAIRPGDVLLTMQGTSIEIISTDAEGRLLLADAVYYAQQEYKPRLLVNIATLTGSAVRALSDEYAAVITRDFALAQRMMSIGEASGEHVWPLPLHPNHFKQIKSETADIKNSGAGNPGASIGAAVVATFVDESLPWVHLDIAGVDYLTEANSVTPRGKAGWGVRFMDQLIRQESETSQ
ncbi:leucyl aminopeptidase family protein [Alteromonas sp. ASW11-36]|uniref:Leucyl aminopeptidase family protein n=1 Tax=Alteromonas arenosi TaxID=3055817 RepID=A0ABT7T020_9ALTE|nr:leucyl aminopeptidase family protein [Alteromonas sp. ASW11-36]MDM7861791.1 leucyl aminopeptidase family protein [Alteromonas sp. ASW11-36]